MSECSLVCFLALSVKLKQRQMYMCGQFSKYYSTMSYGNNGDDDESDLL